MLRVKSSLIALSAATAVMSLALAQTATTTRDGQKYGWTEQADIVNADTIGRALTELERLSQSSSGAGFAESLYNAVTDNPLIPVSVTLRALDKITAQFTDLTINIGEVQDFGKLRVLPRTCSKRPPEEVPETSAFLEIIDLDELKRVEKAEAEALLLTADAEVAPDVALDDTVVDDAVVEDVLPGGSETVTAEELGIETPDEFKKVPAIFKGWMFASSPALNAVEHPVYDVWVIDCKMTEPKE